MAGRPVYLAAKEVEEETQWSVRLGEDAWTELDVVQPGARTTINGGVSGGWFGWGRRQDGPLHRGLSARSGALLHNEAQHIGTTDRQDKELERFNKEFIKRHPVYRQGLSSDYTFRLVSLLTGPGHLLESLVTLSLIPPVEEVTYSVQEEDEDEEEDPTFLPFNTEKEGDSSDDDDDDESESSEDSYEDSEALENGDRNEDSFYSKDDSHKKEMIEHDEMTERIEVGCKRKLDTDQEENEGVKRQRSVEDVALGDNLDDEKGVYYDLNNSLETGYTSELYSDLEEDIASY